MNEGRSNIRYFVIELIVNSIFFVVSAAICLNLYAYGFTENMYSSDLSMATSEIQNIAETVKAVNGNKDKLQELLGAELVGDTLIVYYSATWQTAAPSSSYYTISIETETERQMLTANITASTKEHEIMDLKVKKYMD